jgi:hypothetical protein
MIKKIALSVCCALLVLLITWIYQNYDFSMSVEDAFLKKVLLWKDKIYSAPSQVSADLLFINTGKDLALVDDSVDYGNVVVSDREKIYQLVHYINRVVPPAFTTIDLQFYYPYSIHPQTDSLLAHELQNNERILIPLVKDKNNNYKKPLYDARYGYSDYRTFGPAFNKFRVLNQGTAHSVPIAMNEVINHVVYRDHFFYATANNRLCLSSIWPSYYLKNDDVIAIPGQVVMKSHITFDSPKSKEKKNIKIQYYNLGELLLDIEGDSVHYRDFFKDKLVFIGNFNDDVHITPVGKMSGPVLLANIYLSLLNEQHIVNTWFFIFLWVVFSAISYVSLYKKIPELKLNFKFLFSSYFVKFIRGYVSYFGCMFLLSIIVLLVFNVQVALFLPSLLFTGIEYIRQKKFETDQPAK